MTTSRLPPKRAADTVKSVVGATYAELIERLCAEKGWELTSRAAANFKSLVNTWCRFHGGTLEAPARATLSDTMFDQKLAAITDDMAQASGRPDAAKNVRSAVTQLKHFFDALVLNQELPWDFNRAFKALLDVKGTTWHKLGQELERSCGFPKEVRTTLQRYYFADIHPQKRKSLPLIRSIERVLEVAPGTLVSRAFPEVRPIRNAGAAPVGYRENLRLVTQSRYILKQLPLLVEPIWRKIVEWRTQSVVRVGTKFHSREPGAYWASKATVNRVHTELRAFFGYLVLPASVEHVASGVRVRGRIGKGLPATEVTFNQLFDLGLLMDFFEFRKARTEKEQFSCSNQYLLSVLCSWVNKPDSFLVAHPEYASLFRAEIGPNGDWSAYLISKHQALLGMRHQLQKIQTTIRVPEAPLKTLFDDANPYTLLLEMALRMEQNLPPKVHKTTHALALRDLVVVRMLLEVPLRSKNMIDLEVKTSLVFERETGLWRVQIPKSSLKNHHSRHAHDINRTYSESTSQLMSTYWKEARPQLRDPERSNIFILPTWRGAHRRKKDLDRLGICHADLYMLLKKQFVKYFGVGIGSNVFRHVIATSILKEDSSRFATAAAVLNNSEKMIRKSYSHIKQVDELRWADQWRAKQVERFGDDPPRE